MKNKNESSNIPAVLKRSKTGRASTDIVLSHIVEGLVDGTYQPGQKINAKQISAELDVTIVPVREALHYLAGEGLIELLALKGARIPILDTKQIIRWWDIFYSLARTPMKEAATAISAEPELASKITFAISRINISTGSENPRRFVIDLLNFHQTLNEITNLPEYDEAARRLQIVFWCSYLPKFINFSKYADEFAQHYSLIADLVKVGAGDAAVSMFEWHVRWSSALIKGVEIEPGLPWSDVVSS